MMTFVTLNELIERSIVKPSVNHLDKCYEFFSQQRDNFSLSCNFIIVGDSGHVSANINKACHGTISYHSILSPRCVATDMATERSRVAWWRKVVITGRGNPDWEIPNKQEVFKPFLDWFLNESYYAPFIIEVLKTPDGFIEGLIVTADLPTPFLQNLLITTRYLLECSPKSFEKFNELVGKGIDPRVAYVCCFSTSFSHYRSFGQDLNISLVSEISGHRALRFLGLDAMKNFLNNRFKAESVGPDRNFRINKDFYGGLDIHGDSPNGSFIKELLVKNERLRDTLSEYRKKEQHGETYRPPNPFDRLQKTPPREPLSFTYTEMFDCLIPTIHEMNLLTE